MLGQSVSQKAALWRSGFQDALPHIHPENRAIKDPGPWEGEPRNMRKPTVQTALWFHGGNLHQWRHFSHHLALQLKARL